MKYEVEEVRDFLVIHIVGDMTKKSHLEILDGAITEHIEDGFHKFVFNLEKVEKLDLDGIDLFIGCLTDVSGHSGGCYIVCEEDAVLEVLHNAGLDGMMNIYRSDAEFEAEHGISALA